MKPLKHEIDAVSAVLDQGTGDLSKIATQVITALDATRSQLQRYGLLFAGGDTGIVVGPFRTVGQAASWAENNGLGPDDAVRVVLRAPEYNDEGG